MSDKEADKELDNHPDFGLSPYEKFSHIKSFIRTKRAISKGEPLFDYNKSQLEGNSYMGPWKFNLTESIFAVLPALAALNILTFLFPEEVTENLDELTTLTVKLMSWVSPVLIPLSLFLVAWAAGHSSLLKEDRSKENRRRATFAYLYYDGGYGLIAQALLVLGITIEPYVFRQDIPEGIEMPSLIVVLLVMLIGLIWTIVVTGKKVPNLLWVLHGYSSKKRSFFRKRDPSTKYAPHTKYALTVGFGAPILYGVSIFILGLLAKLVAYFLLHLKTAVIG